MNKRRRFKAKAVRKWSGGVRRQGFVYASIVDLGYQVCATCGDYVMACTCYEKSLEGLKRIPNVTITGTWDA